MANFFASGIANLGDKLGPILWQLPPILRFDPERLAPFLASLPRDTDHAAAIARRRNDKVKGRTRLAFGPCRPLRHALEVRHPSFVDPAFVELLREQNVALVVADTAGKWPYAEDVTADDWKRNYSRELAAFPVGSLRHQKYWPPVGRIDGAYGDRNVMCSCPPIESYA